MKVDIKITFECPACKQINDGVSFNKAIEIETELEYTGSGEYLSAIDTVSIKCSGCKVETEVEY